MITYLVCCGIFIYAYIAGSLSMAIYINKNQHIDFFDVFLAIVWPISYFLCHKTGWPND